MSRMKFLCAVLLTAAIGSVVPQARAQVTVKVVIAGSSGIWQAMGVGTYKGELARQVQAQAAAITRTRILTSTILGLPSKVEPLKLT